uniref:4HBT domain-containing protein n=1 Tax=Angiostrongylus cantonensis TaxID=6313 RepID=A0A0K0D7Z4_ANGCA
MILEALLVRRHCIGGETLEVISVAATFSFYVPSEIRMESQVFTEVEAANSNDFSFMQLFRGEKCSVAEMGFKVYLNDFKK